MNDQKAVLSDSQDGPIAEVPTDVSEREMERQDDIELAKIVRSRRHETSIPVSLDDL
jgi:antitoxin StbD